MNVIIQKSYFWIWFCWMGSGYEFAFKLSQKEPILYGSHILTQFTNKPVTTSKRHWQLYFIRYKSYFDKFKKWYDTYIQYIVKTASAVIYPVAEIVLCTELQCKHCRRSGMFTSQIEHAKPWSNAMMTSWPAYTFLIIGLLCRNFTLLSVDFLCKGTAMLSFDVCFDVNLRADTKRRVLVKRPVRL